MSDLCLIRVLSQKHRLDMQISVSSLFGENPQTKRLLMGLAVRLSYNLRSPSDQFQFHTKVEIILGQEKHLGPYCYIPLPSRFYNNLQQGLRSLYAPLNKKKSSTEKPEVLLFILKVTLLNHMATSLQATGAARGVKVMSLHGEESEL